MIELDNNLVLAPMAGVTDLPFRILCKEQGCGLLCTEMVSAKAILYKNRNTRELLEVTPGERPVSVQLFGSDPEIVSDMAHLIEDGPFDIIDFNMGCPVPKVVNNGEGSALMRSPKLAEKIFTALIKKVHKPVTVKFRKGFDDSSVNAVEIAKIAEACGMAAVAVHGRTREQFYAGKADWEIIRVSQTESLSGYRGASSRAGLQGDWRNDLPTCPDADGKKGRKPWNEGNAQAYCLVYSRASPLSRNTASVQYAGDIGGASEYAGGAWNAAGGVLKQ